MIVTCEKCGNRFNDEVRWTICPHRLLSGSPTGPRGTSVGYCAEHDLFGCPFEHEAKKPVTMAALQDAFAKVTSQPNQIHYTQRVGASSCIRCDYKTNAEDPFDKQDADMMEHLNQNHPDWMLEGLPRPDDLFRQKYVPDWPNASVPAWPDPPQVPQAAFDYAKMMNDAVEKLTGAEPLLARKKLGLSSHFGLMEVRESRFVPKGEVWMVNSLGDVHKIINIANELRDADALSLCCGEMK